jgi:deoxyadenosine/deoxycytidine kinase
MSMVSSFRLVLLCNSLLPFQVLGSQISILFSSHFRTLDRSQAPTSQFIEAMAVHLVTKNLRIHMEGTIGAGKSTFLNQFRHNSNVSFIQEDLERWQGVPGVSVGESNLLEKFYADPSRWGHAFETYVLMTKAEGHHQIVPTPIKIMERSVHSAALVFSKLLFGQGLLTELEHGLLMDHYRHHLQDGRCDVDLWVYLRTPAEIAFGRVQTRGRAEEIGVVSLDYLQALEKKYDEFFAQVTEPVIVIDGSGTVEEIFAQTKKEIEKILPSDLAGMLNA